MIDLFTVYGDEHINHINHNLIPSLIDQTATDSLKLNTINYKRGNKVIPSVALEKLIVRDWSDHLPHDHLGFGESINTLFKLVSPKPFFIVLNPDTRLDHNFIADITKTYQNGDGILEGRQWPNEHPKEYDQMTGETPWASGACFLMSSRCFEEISGFDPVYFMYCEDVDLSWRTWLNGYKVRYIRDAICQHYTGILYYRNDRFYLEHFFSARNFLVISFKFFGYEGEERALNLLSQQPYPAKFRSTVRDAYFSMKVSIRPYSHERGDCLEDNATLAPLSQFTQIKITDFNRYHDIRQVHG